MGISGGDWIATPESMVFLLWADAVSTARTGGGTVTVSHAVATLLATTFGVVPALVMGLRDCSRPDSPLAREPSSSSWSGDRSGLSNGSKYEKPWCSSTAVRGTGMSRRAAGAGSAGRRLAGGLSGCGPPLHLQVALETLFRREHRRRREAVEELGEFLPR